MDSKSNRYSKPGGRRLYDVVPRPMLATERYLAIGVGEQGRVATLGNALSQCEQFGLSKPEAAAIIIAVTTAVRSWRESFEVLGVPARECDRVAPAFRRANDIGMQTVESAVD